MFDYIWLEKRVSSIYLFVYIYRLSRLSNDIEIAMGKLLENNHNVQELLRILNGCIEEVSGLQVAPEGTNCNQFNVNPV